MRLHLFDHGHRPHLLFVAGSRAFAESMAQSASPDHFETSIATSRAEALKSCAAHEFTGYVIDANLPDADGAELVRELRESKVTAPVLFIDSLAGSSAIKIDAEATLTKPLALPEFRAALRELFLGADVALDATSATRRRRASFHLSTLIIPLLLAAGIALTYWLLRLT